MSPVGTIDGRVSVCVASLINVAASTDEKVLKNVTRKTVTKAELTHAFQRAFTTCVCVFKVITLI